METDTAEARLEHTSFIELLPKNIAFFRGKMLIEKKRGPL